MQNTVSQRDTRWAPGNLLTEAVPKCRHEKLPRHARQSSTTSVLLRRRRSKHYIPPINGARRADRDPRWQQQGRRRGPCPHGRKGPRTPRPHGRHRWRRDDRHCRRGRRTSARSPEAAAAHGGRTGRLWAAWRCRRRATSCTQVRETHRCVSSSGSERVEGERVVSLTGVMVDGRRAGCARPFQPARSRESLFARSHRISVVWACA